MGGGGRCKALIGLAYDLNESSVGTKNGGHVKKKRARDG